MPGHLPGSNMDWPGRGCLNNLCQGTVNTPFVSDTGEPGSDFREGPQKGWLLPTPCTRAALAVEAQSAASYRV